MNLFKINPWILCTFFTVPSLFLSEEPVFFSGFHFVFFLMLFIFFVNYKNSRGEAIKLRSKLECLGLLSIFLIYPIEYLIGKIDFGKPVLPFFGVIYFLVIFDLAISLSAFWDTQSKKPTLSKTAFYIFFSLLVPPLGIYYLRKVYLRSEVLANQSSH